MKILFIVGLGSFIGGCSRYLTQQFITRQIPVPLPYGTLVVNIVGCFLIGIIYALSDEVHIISSEAKLFLATGLCGGFTTFSSFSIDTFGLLKDGQLFYAFSYVGISILAGFFATYLGIQLIKLL